MEIKDIANDMKSGVFLCHLIEIISNKDIDQFNNFPKCKSRVPCLSLDVILLTSISGIIFTLLIYFLKQPSMPSWRTATLR